jgi:uncharacterized repeat protein (TIGR01451 family)
MISSKNFVLRAFTLGMISSFCANAQFGLQIDLSKSTGPVFATLAVDVNNDNQLDIVAAGNKDKLIWWELDSNGRIIDTTQIDGFIHDALIIKSIDYDKDGDNDILAASTVEGIRLYTNDGQGNFSIGLLTQSKDSRTNVLIEDFNNDTWLDIAYKESTDNHHIVIHFNQQDGSFKKEELPLASSSGYRGFEAIDVNNDSLIDIAFVTIGQNINYRNISWYENLGQGKFSSPKTLLTDLQHTTFIKTADFNNDGKADILHVSSSLDELELFLNNGNSTFSSSATVSCDGPNYVDIYDINGDSLLDILVTTSLSNGLFWAENQGGTSFSNRNTIWTSGSSKMYAIAGDFDSDQEPEVIHGTSDVLMLHYENQGTWTPENLSSSKTTPKQLMTLDLNNDGSKDIVEYVKGSGYRDKVVVYFNKGGINYDKETLLHTGISDINRFYVGDVNSDGIENLIGLTTSDSLYYFEYVDGQLSSKKKIESNSLTGVKHIQVIDFNKNGSKELLFCAKNGDQGGWIENITTTPNENLIDSSKFKGEFIKAINYNSDSLYDLIVLSEYKDSAFIYIDTGNFSFVRTISLKISNSETPQRADYLDFNGDSLKDIVVYFGKEGKIIPYLLYVYENMGDSTYTEQKISLSLRPSYLDGDFVLDDLDHDGDLDVIYSVSGDVIYWSEQNDNWGFSSPNIISSFVQFTDRTYNMILADLDLDGDKELVYGGNRTGMHESLIDGEYKISGNVYLHKDNGDSSGFNKFNILIQPSNKVVFVNKNGSFDAFLKEGDYSVSVSKTNNWDIISEHEVYNISLNESNKLKNHIDFLISPINIEERIISNLSSGGSRCNTEIHNNIFIESQYDFELDSVIIEVNLDASNSYVGDYGNSTPSKTDANKVTWVLYSVPSFERMDINFVIKTPGFEKIGDTLMTTLVVKPFFNGTILEECLDTLKIEHKCENTPNDKSVTSSSNGNETSVATKDTLTYTIRFQNTGNDTAVNILIRDSIDSKLDLTSFKLLNTTHTMTYQLNGESEMLFVFKGIKLTDSTISKTDSKGELVYTITTKDFLSPKEVIKNKARIYFDTNPPIITNTTSSKIECYNLPILIEQKSDSIVSDSLFNQFTWLFNGDSLTEPNLRFVLTDLGNYQLVTTDEYGCNHSSNTLSPFITSTKEYTREGVLVYPNPIATNFFIINGVDLNKKVSITDLNGRIVDFNQTNIGTNKASFSIKTHTNGVYLVNFHGIDGESRTDKIILK